MPAPTPTPADDEPRPVPQGTRGFDDGRPPGPTPARDFWEVLYTRRSIRRFKADPVPEDLVRQVLHAGIWAPSSCNYQMWDVVAVADPEVNGKLAALSRQLGNAPVNLVVSYGRDFSEDGWANIQSASAMIQNMSLAAAALGLGSFWITQLGDREEVRELVGLPPDRLVIAALALGFPEKVPDKGPKRRPLAHVTHTNRYAGESIPSSADPADWKPEQLAIYQRARVLNGLKHNKPRAWETTALAAFLERFVPEGTAQVEGEHVGRWLDVLPCTGILTDQLSRARRGYAFDVVERTPEVADFVAARTLPRGTGYAWPAASREPGFESPPEDGYDIVSCLYRLEGLDPLDRGVLLGDLARWVKRGGRVLLGFVNARSFHGASERLRARRGGLGGVEYVLSPDPNIGPFEALDADLVVQLAESAGLELVGQTGLQAFPPRSEVDFRTRNFSLGMRGLVRGATGLARCLEGLPGLRARRGRFQCLCLRRR